MGTAEPISPARENPMTTETRSMEQRILVVMRKVLAQIVKETTPPPGARHPLSEQTIEDIRQCFALISARERRLAEAAGLEIKERPRFTDEPQTTKVVSINNITKPPSKTED